MSFTVVDGAQGTFHPCYRGTFRTIPFYRSELSEDAEWNQAVIWFYQNSIEAVVHDRTLVPQLIDLRNRLTALDSSYSFEVIEMVLDGESPTCGTTFLGVDLSVGMGYSILDGWKNEDFERRLRERSDPASVLASLICEHFGARLNKNILFEDFATACECVRAINAVQALAPGSYEFGVFLPTGVYAVTEGTPRITE